MRGHASADPGTGFSGWPLGLLPVLSADATRGDCRWSFLGQRPRSRRGPVYASRRSSVGCATLLHWSD